MASSPLAPPPSYPLHAEDGGFFAASGVVSRTGSYSMERATATAMYAGVIGGVLLVGVGLTGALAMYVSQAAAGVVFLVVCLAVVFGVMPYVETQLWQMRAAYAWLVTEVVVRGAIPDGGASAAANRFLTERFGDLGPVVDSHNKVQGMIRSFFRTFDKLDGLLPIDLSQVRSALGFATDRVSPRIADLGISLAIARGDNDFAEASRDAVTYVAQNPSAILGAAIRGYVTERVLGALVGAVAAVAAFGAVFVAVGSLSAGAIAGAGMGAQGSQVATLFASGFAGLFVGLPLGALVSWFVNTAFLEPIGLAMLIVRFHTVIQNQPVDPAMRARIDNASGNLRSAQKILGLAS